MYDTLELQNIAKNIFKIFSQTHIPISIENKFYSRRKQIQEKQKEDSQQMQEHKLIRKQKKNRYKLYQFSRATTTKQRGLNNINLFSHRCRFWKPQIKRSAQFVWGGRRENLFMSLLQFLKICWQAHYYLAVDASLQSLPYLHMTFSLLYSCCLSSVCFCLLLYFLFIKTAVILDQGSLE